MSEIQKRAFSGAAGRLYFDGRPVGWCTSVNGQEVISNAKVRVLGDMYAQEIEPVAVDVSFSCGLVHIKEEDLRAMGVWPEANTLDIANWPPMTAEIYDEVAKAPVYTIKGVKPASRSFSFEQGGIMMKNASFDAIKLFDGAAK